METVTRKMEPVRVHQLIVGDVIDHLNALHEVEALSDTKLSRVIQLKPRRAAGKHMSISLPKHNWVHRLER